MPKPRNCLKAIRKTLLWTTYMKFDCLVRVLRAYLIVPHDLFFSHFFFHFRRYVIDVNSLDIRLFGFRHLGWHHSSILCPLLWVQICLVGVKLLRFYPAIIFWWLTLNTHQKFIFFKGEMRVTQIKPMLFYLMQLFQSSSSLGYIHLPMLIYLRGWFTWVLLCLKFSTLSLTLVN